MTTLTLGRGVPCSSATLPEMLCEIAPAGNPRHAAENMRRTQIFFMVNSSPNIGTLCGPGHHAGVVNRPMRLLFPDMPARPAQDGRARGRSRLNQTTGDGIRGRFVLDEAKGRKILKCLLKVLGNNTEQLNLNFTIERKCLG